MKTSPADGETSLPSQIPYWRLILDQKVVTAEIVHHAYDGSGTEDDPYRITWIPHDPRNPMNFNTFTKWAYTCLVSSVTFAIALISSAYSGGISQVIAEFHCSQEVAILGISLFVLGFAFGPLIWAPLSETFGRRHVFTVTFMLLTAFNAGAAGARNIQTLLVLRFLAGFFGSSPFGNAGGTIADMFPAAKRGIALSLFAAAPLCGPTLGPMIGGFLGSGAGWRWVEGLLAAFSGVMWLCLCLLLPETYAPVLLRQRAARLSDMTGKVYRFKLDVERGKPSVTKTLSTALSRPWQLLFTEPIVLLLCIYMAIIYGILYCFFEGFPIVFQEVRGWNEGVGGLAFMGILVGMTLALLLTIPDHLRYTKLAQETPGRIPPERRLPPCILGAFALPVGLFWFAWTNSPSIHWISAVAAGAPFGFGLVLVFLSVINYLIDAYTIFAASVIAANSALRALFGFAFPLFTTYMYRNLGIHWASSIPAFFAVACVPFPILFYRYGAGIRRRCTYAAEADAFMARLLGNNQVGALPAGAGEEKGSPDATTEAGSDGDGDGDGATDESLRRTATQYEENPYDIDRVNTQNSVISGNIRA